MLRSSSTKRTKKDQSDKKRSSFDLRSKIDPKNGNLVPPSTPLVLSNLKNKFKNNPTESPKKGRTPAYKRALNFIPSFGTPNPIDTHSK